VGHLRALGTEIPTGLLQDNKGGWVRPEALKTPEMTGDISHNTPPTETSK
tara:strand:- start:122 stop:271 length:150 start_codon:yes stop_codon:yes gene_type:complete